MSRFPEHILLVNPRAFDGLYIGLLFEEVGCCGRMYVVPSAADAWAFLQQRGSSWKAPQIDLVLVDLGLPSASGEELVRALAGQPRPPFVVAMVPPSKRGDARDLPILMTCPAPLHHDDVQAILDALEERQQLGA